MRKPLPDRQRRHLLAGLAGIAAMRITGFAQAVQPLRIGLTPVFLDERSGFLSRFRAYLEGALGQSVMFVQKRSYAEIVEQMLNGTLQAAWVCGYPFVRYQAFLQLLAVPVYQGGPTYRAYIITRATARPAQDFSELQGKVFAYSDPLSNSGYLYPQDCLKTLKQRDGAFFRKTFFTFSHQNVIAAVASGLADAGSVDGYVWDSVNALSSRLTSRTHILQKSGLFGFPPFVCPRMIEPSMQAKLSAAFVEMQHTEPGKQLLSELRLEKFILAQPSLFDGVAAMMRRVEG